MDFTSAYGSTTWVRSARASNTTRRFVFEGISSLSAYQPTRAAFAYYEVARMTRLEELGDSSAEDVEQCCCRGTFLWADSFLLLALLDTMLFRSDASTLRNVCMHNICNTGTPSTLLLLIATKHVFCPRRSVRPAVAEIFCGSEFLLPRRIAGRGRCPWEGFTSMHHVFCTMQPKQPCDAQCTTPS